MSEHHPEGASSEPVLPEQTSDDLVDPREEYPDDDLQRFLDDKPPHHLD